MSAKRGARVLGPYEERAGWRVVEIDASGNRTPILFLTEAKAVRYVDIARAELSREDHTTATALAAYRKHLTEKGDKSRSIETTVWAIEMFFPDALPLATLTTKQCAALYESLRTTPRERTGKPPSADTHRNVLSQAKSLLAWCVKQGWIRENPLASVAGTGKRRPRGMSLGKSGNTLRVKEARAWYREALYRAHRGDTGATAALVAMLLGMRASEIVGLRAGAIDEDTAPGDLVWIDCAKSPAGRRTLEVPAVLRPLLVARAADKAPERYLFEAEESTPEESRPHWRDWIRKNVARISGLAKVPRMTAHACRGLLATITAERGTAGHVIAATLGHEDERTTMTAYAAPGAAAAGANRRGIVLLEGGAK